MPETSRTGLIPSNKKISKVKIKEVATLKLPNLVFPAPFTLRPFAGIYNPYPYGCSILCNHPTDLEAKEIVQKAKDAWVTEGKCLIELEGQATFKSQRKKVNSNSNSKEIEEKSKNQSSENLFLNDYNCDSRPLTPAATLVSAATEMSQNLKTRRCFTPDPSSLIPNNQRTLLVLDLRRSHSQETISLQRNKISNFDSDPGQSESFISMAHNKRKKITRNKSAASSLKIQSSEDPGQKVRTTDSSSHCKSPSKCSLLKDQKHENSKSYDSSGGDSSKDFEKVTKRRGKKRKGKKSKRNEPKEGEKEFKGIPDPNETQVSALGTESQNENSSGPPSKENPLKDDDVSSETAMEAFATKEKNQNSFLNFDILRHFQRELNQETVDAEMDRRRKKALAEALRQKAQTKTVTERRHRNEEIRLLKDVFENAVGEDPEDWLSIPRVFTRRSARFELPMDSRLLKDLTPFRYVQSYVFPSPARLILYNHVFKLFMEDFEEDEDGERIILGKNVCSGLGKIMGRPLTPDESENFQKLIGWRNEDGLNFRTFTGISAACERLLGSSFCSDMPEQTEDPRHEVEIADFETLEGKLNRLKPNENLSKMLRLIRDL